MAILSFITITVVLSDPGLLLEIRFASTGWKFPWNVENNLLWALKMILRDQRSGAMGVSLHNWKSENPQDEYSLTSVLPFSLSKRKKKPWFLGIMNKSCFPVSIALRCGHVTKFWAMGEKQKCQVQLPGSIMGGWGTGRYDGPNVFAPPNFTG